MTSGMLFFDLCLIYNKFGLYSFITNQHYIDEKI